MKQKQDRADVWGSAFRAVRLAKAAETGEEWTQARVAHAAHMTASTYGRIEAGRSTLTKKLDAIAEALGVDVSLSIKPKRTASKGLQKLAGLRDTPALSTGSYRPTRRSPRVATPLYSSSASPEDRDAELSPNVIAIVNAFQKIVPAFEQLAGLAALVPTLERIADVLPAVERQRLELQSTIDDKRAINATLADRLGDAVTSEDDAAYAARRGQNATVDRMAGRGRPARTGHVPADRAKQRRA